MNVISKSKSGGVILWGAHTNALAEQVSRELSKQSRARADLSLQIEPEARTIEFAALRVSEFLRFSFDDFSTLRKEVQRSQSSYLILDMWRLLFMAEFDFTCEGLFKVLGGAKRTILLIPRRGLAFGEFTVHPEILRRIGFIHECLINTSAYDRVHAVVSPPTLEGFLGTVGLKELLPARRLGFKAVPDVLRSGVAKFSSCLQIANRISHCLFANESQEQSNVSLDSLCSVLEADKALAVPTSEFLIGCSWENYLRFHKKQQVGQVHAFEAGKIKGFLSESGISESLYLLARNGSLMETVAVGKNEAEGLFSVRRT